MFEGAGVTVLVTVFGFIVLALVGALIGYVVSNIGWRFLVGRKWARRTRRRARAMEPAA